MALSVQRVLLNTLEELTETQLRKFCARLLDREDEPRVRRNAVDGKDAIAVVDVLVSTFTKAGAGGVAVDALRAIDRNDLVETLEASLPAVRCTRSMPQPRVEPGVHFVDQHRTSLVQRIRTISPILDKLRDHKVVNEEQCATILAKDTPQNKVRELYDGPLASSGAKGKDIFLSVLQEMEPFLIEDLRKCQ